MRKKKRYSKPYRDSYRVDQPSGIPVCKTNMYVCMYVCVLLIPVNIEHVGLPKNVHGY